MNILKKSAYFMLGVGLFACDDPNVIGLDLPGSARFTVSNDSIQNFETSTISEDNLRSDESLHLLLGQINDPIFGENKGAFATQMLLPSNNIEEIQNVVIDSVLITYSYTDFYGDLNESNDLDINVFKLEEDINKDSIYYSNYSPAISNTNLAIGNKIYDGDSISSAYINIHLDNSIGQELIDASGSSSMIDNESFLDFFKGLYVEATASNTILYLNPTADKSRFSVYYHEVGVDTAVSLDFELGGNAARINIFNDKDSSFLVEEEEKAYVQSMAGHKVKLEFLNRDYLHEMFSGKAINKVSIDFECIEDLNYPPHEKIYLVRETKDGEIVLLKDFTIEGDQHFGGEIDGTTYRFNITRYFVQLLTNDEYTDVLYLLPSGGSANANRTILDESKTSIKIIYTDI
tara:strand:- start:1928 stop:3139 length:1212 start_codon:yes stop_codon:yes gene_type:complete